MFFNSFFSSGTEEDAAAKSEVGEQAGVESLVSASYTTTDVEDSYKRLSSTIDTDTQVDDQSNQSKEDVTTSDGNSMSYQKKTVDVDDEAVIVEEEITDDGSAVETTLSKDKYPRSSMVKQYAVPPDTIDEEIVSGDDEVDLEQNVTERTSQKSAIDKSSSKINDIDKDGFGKNGFGGDVVGEVVEEKEMQDTGEQDKDDMDMESFDAEGQLLPWRPGELTCCCLPTRVAGFRDGCARTADWTTLNGDELVGGLTVAMAQVPEMISYCILAGVDPLLSLQGAWVTNIVTVCSRGRPRALISGTTSAIALALVSLVQNSGPEYVVYAVALAGLMQIVFGLLKFGGLLRFISFPAMLGFVNIMALMVGLNQLKFLKVPKTGINANMGSTRLWEIGFHTNSFDVLMDGTPWVDLPTLIVILVEAVTAFLICLFLPMVSKTLPSTFVALLMVTMIEWVIARRVEFPSTLVGEFTDIKAALPSCPLYPFKIPPLNLETFQKVWPTGIAVFAVSTVESLLSCSLISREQGTEALSNVVVVGQGVANVLSSLLVGGTGGGIMMTESVLNKASGAVTALSTFVAALSMFAIATGAYAAVAIVPVAAFVGIMFYVVYHLIQWRAFVTFLAVFFPQRLRDVLFLDCKVNRIDTIIMLVVMTVTFFFDLALGAIAGAVLSAFAYAWDSSNTLQVDRVLAEGEETVTYRINGPLCFSSARVLRDIFSSDVLRDDPGDVILLLEEAEIFDWSGMVALKDLYKRIEASGRTVALSSLTPSSKRIMEKNSSMWYGVVFLEMQEIEEGVEEGGEDSAADQEKIAEEEENDGARLA